MGGEGGIEGGAPSLKSTTVFTSYSKAVQLFKELSQNRSGVCQSSKFFFYLFIKKDI